MIGSSRFYDSGRKICRKVAASRKAIEVIWRTPPLAVKRLSVINNGKKQKQRYIENRNEKLNWFIKGGSH